jgi:TonB-linked SusC/RagA family outer membrane protein
MKRAFFKQQGLLCRLIAGLLLVLLVNSSYGQEGTVTGVVKDEKGTGIPSVTISVKGSPVKTTTNAEGKFDVKAGTGSVLVFTAVGYDPLEVPVRNTKQLTVTLSEHSDMLQNVVVIGYGTQKVTEVTSSVARVKSSDFNQGGVQSPMDLIRGRVAGLTVTRTGGNNNPNAGSSIQLRGVTSLTGGNDPLIVIDGVPGGNLNLLQQDDIESFDVLKDGSAAAIYGTRGNAGVILITTKKGKAGDPQYNYSTYFSKDIVRKKPDVLTADEYRQLKADPANPYAGLMTDQGGTENYYDQLLNKSNITQYHNFSASGGSAKSNYRASLLYSDNQGMAKQNGNTQYGGRLNVNQRGLQDRLSLQINLSANVRKQNLNGGNSGDFEQAVQQNPTQPVFNPDGTYNVLTGTSYYNPIARLYQEKSMGERTLLSGDAKMTITILPGLRASLMGAIIRNSYLEDQYRDRASKSSLDSYRGGGYAYKYSALTVNRTLEPTIEYSNTFAGKHTVNAVGGYSFQDEAYQNFSAGNSGYLTDAFAENNLGAGTDLTAGKATQSSTRSSSRLIAFFGRVNYNFSEKYLASFILRHEGSSKFGADHKWGNFPAVSAGWNISKEDFMSSIKAINNLKIRVGYGITGNQDIANYQSIVSLGTGGQYLNNGIWFQTYGPTNNPNPDLRWEKKKEFNAGLDFVLLNARISGSLDVYKRKTEDLLASYNTQVPPFVTPSVYTNVGSIENNGIELALQGVLIKKQDFNWTANLTFNYQSNELSSISDDVFKASYFEYGGLPAPGSLGNAIRTQEGAPLGQFYGKRFAGFNQNGKWLFYKADGTTGTTSEMTTKDLSYIGNGVPKYMASLGSRLSYRAFDLSIFFRGKFQFDLLNMPDMYFGNKKWLGNNILKSALGRNAQILDDPQYSNYYLEKGDFVKLDNITIGYNLPLNQGAIIRSLRVYASGQNLATFTGYKGLDPELQDTGLTTGMDNRGFYPQTTTFTLGLNIGF